ncbi:MAG: GNAT family N-acetyltransferase [Alphaproteobacteria bacterium]|nr:GNAT family N-acetyltransferase [Alphaproteobacteria bacterium]MDE1987528.1 GNAT family N-acetyltransferase [Alphaproteobacteria bacterium]MDE2163986.1 GNAT family N-acetyltransferase [Alphaproteobacteria bacterium]
MANVSIRPANPSDAALILSFIRDLAAYEKLSHEVAATEADVHAKLFGANPRVFCNIAEIDGEPAGFAVWFFNFSTFLGRHGLYLEDLYVHPQFRGKGVGRALLAHLARHAVAEGCGRLEWWVLDWNAPAIDFYKSLGAVAMSDWTVFRVTGDALERLAKA